jgi:quercetin dioxygenase-like cupin family protein
MSIKRTILQTFPIPQLEGWESRLVLLEYPPGAVVPQHRHPIAGTGYVVEGDVISQWEGGEIERYFIGNSFIDCVEKLYVRSENVNKDKPLKFG